MAYNKNAIAAKPWILIEDPSPEDIAFRPGSLWDVFTIQTTLKMGHFTKGTQFKHRRSGIIKMVNFNSTTRKYSLVKVSTAKRGRKKRWPDQNIQHVETPMTQS